MNPKNNKTSDPHRLLINPTGKIDLRREDKYIALSHLSIYFTWENIKSHVIIINLKYSSNMG